MKGEFSAKLVGYKVESRNDGLGLGQMSIEALKLVCTDFSHKEQSCPSLPSKSSVLYRTSHVHCRQVGLSYGLSPILSLT